MATLRGCVDYFGRQLRTPVSGRRFKLLSPFSLVLKCSFVPKLACELISLSENKLFCISEREVHIHSLARMNKKEFPTFSLLSKVEGIKFPTFP
jgi:hypothetical protein